MNSWKEGFANKLSYLLSDKPSSIPLSDAHCSHSFPPQMRKELSFDDNCVPPQKRSTFSSIFFSFLPPAYSGAGRSASSSPQDLVASPSRSHSKSVKLSTIDFKDRLPENAANGKAEGHSDFAAALVTENDNNVSERNVKATMTSLSLNDSAEFLPFLMEKSIFVSAVLFEFLHSCLPNIVRGCQWVLLYSTMRHGISLRTLIRRSAILAGPCLLIVGDMQGAIFGGLLDGPLKPTVKRKYQGTNQVFVFTTIYGEPRLFGATGVNRYYYLCLDDILAFGGGGSFALSLEEDLLHGTSGPSETFANLCLAHSEEFELKNVELWGFTHSSRYFSSEQQPSS